MCVYKLLYFSKEKGLQHIYRKKNTTCGFTPLTRHPHCCWSFHASACFSLLVWNINRRMLCKSYILKMEQKDGNPVCFKLLLQTHRKVNTQRMQNHWFPYTSFFMNSLCDCVFEAHLSKNFRAVPAVWCLPQIQPQAARNDSCYYCMLT